MLLLSPLLCCHGHNEMISKTVETHRVMVVFYTLIDTQIKSIGSGKYIALLLMRLMERSARWLDIHSVGINQTIEVDLNQFVY